MSRIGKNPIALPQGVEIKINGNVVEVKGPKGELSQEIHPALTVSVDENTVLVERADDSKEQRAMHGLYRSLINNMVEGVSKGYKTVQELVGVGYRANISGKVLEMNLGFSHNIFMQIPAEVKCTTESVKGQPPKVILESHDKQLIGQVAAKIRSLRPPEPYKGKGIKFEGEQLRRKAGKTAAK